MKDKKGNFANSLINEYLKANKQRRKRIAKRETGKSNGLRILTRLDGTRILIEI